MSNPPSADDAERSLLGCVLIGAHMDDLADEIQGRDFWQPRHEAIWNAALDVHRHGDRPDVPLVSAALGGDLARAGGPEYLFGLASPDVAPSPVQAGHYARIVVEAALKRRLMDAGTRVHQIAQVADDATIAAEEARKIIEEASSHGINDTAGASAADLVRVTVDAMETEQDPGIDTGWPDLDEPVNGLRPGQLIIVGARPSVGKSVIAANLAAHACSQGVAVHFASLEMTNDEITKRMLAARASVDLTRLMNHDLRDDDWAQIARRGDQVRAWPLWIDDTPGQTLNQIRSRARSTRRRIGLGLLVVDYLQLMAPRDRRAPREQQVGEISEGLKNLAKELHVPIVALAQLNRGSTERHDKRPLLSDLRESGRIEQDADHVWLLHRQDLVDPNSTNAELEIYIAKNRNGPSGRTVKLSFQGQYSRAVNLAWSPTRGIA